LTNSPAQPAARLSPATVPLIDRDMAEIIHQAKKRAGLFFVERTTNNQTKLEVLVDTNQLRNFYEALVQLGMELREIVRTKLKANPSLTEDSVKIEKSYSQVDRVILLPSKLAWSAARMKGESAKAATKFYVEVDGIVKSLFEADAENSLNYARFKRFQQYVETVIIYHKARKEKVVSKEDLM